MVDIVGLYDTLLSASIAGVAFEIIDTRTQSGRRMQRFLFPGVDRPVFQDLGRLDGPIEVQGLLAGDDYVEQAARLAAALRRPGPYLLVHPWLGQVRVVHSGPFEISFAEKELRIVRVKLALWLYQDPAAAAPDTLSALMDAGDQAIADAQSWLAAILAPPAQALAAFGYAQGWLAQVGTLWTGLLSAGPSGAEIGAATVQALASLAGLVASPGSIWADAASAALVGVPAAIAAAASPVVPSAVAPGGTLTAAAPANPADAAAMLLGAIPSVPGAAFGAPGPALAAALVGAIVANAAIACTAILYPSQQAAQAQAALLYAAIDEAAALCAVLAGEWAVPAATLWRDLVSLRGAVAADMNALIGRLPTVVTITLPGMMPVWLLAQYVSGDDPSQVVATYIDLIARNGVADPAMIGPGPVEVLNG